MKTRTKTRPNQAKTSCPTGSAVTKRRLTKPKDLAAFLLGLLCLIAAAAAAYHVLIAPLAIGFILVAAPICLILLAVLALLALKH